MTEAVRSSTDEIAEDYVRGNIIRREAVRRLALLGVQGIPAGKLLAAAMAEASAREAAA